MSYLVIVESPTKARTIRRMLDQRRYRVMASQGHLIDLPKSQLGIDIEKGFEPRYITIRGKGSILKELKEAGKKAQKVFLAADPDREGEAICWHLCQALNLDDSSPCRVEFFEITEAAVKEAFKNPHPINMNRVEAQQTRRILDRLVGYQISPLLWRNLRSGLSAGRVQSVAVRLICDREEEIRSFVPEEYWTLEAEFAAGEEESSRFRAELIASGTRRSLSSWRAGPGDGGVGGGPFTVDWVVKSRRKRQPAALQYQQPAAGGLHEAGVSQQQDHVPGPAALRGDQNRLGDGWLDYLYAHGFPAGLRPGPRAGSGVSPEPVRGGLHPPGPSRLPLPPADPGSPRSHSPHIGFPGSRVGAAVPYPGSTAPLPVDLDPLHGQPDGSRSL